ncbi:hypothetical protein T484DRAFT_1814345 [Baffinella frigidus]|nr:hypothetical protein T484DRAFT_1814345 [Cryptophyta sp. CCMP2293]
MAGFSALKRPAPSSLLLLLLLAHHPTVRPFSLSRSHAPSARAAPAFAPAPLLSAVAADASFAPSRAFLCHRGVSPWAAPATRPRSGPRLSGSPGLRCVASPNGKPRPEPTGGVPPSWSSMGVSEVVKTGGDMAGDVGKLWEDNSLYDRDDWTTPLWMITQARPSHARAPG